MGKSCSCVGFCLGVLVLSCLLLVACAPQKPEAPPTRVVVDSSPEPGAAVTIEGLYRGETPVTVEGLPLGWIDVVLEKEGYYSVSDRIEVHSGETRHFVIELDPLCGRLSLESTPLGATVYLDGDKVLGKTPLVKAKVPIGEHTYALKKKDYYSIEEKLTVKEDFAYSFRHLLKPKEATLSVISRPTDARIWLNNKLQTKRAPARFTLTPGDYVVSLHSKGFVQKDVKVTLAPNGDEMLNVKLMPGEVPVGMVLVPAGKFVWGENNRSPDERPRRTVELDAFYIDKCEVSNAQYKQVFSQYEFPPGQEDMPVTGISWSEAGSYAQAVGKRLPTEAEWEKAARGEDGREYPWGMDFDKELCNTAEADVDEVKSVNAYMGNASPYGCINMAGNVYEWTSDWYAAYPGNTDVTKDYGQVYRVLRGGSYLSDRFEARCACRHFDRMDAKRADYGFRCVMDVK